MCCLCAADNGAGVHPGGDRVINFNLFVEGFFFLRKEEFKENFTYLKFKKNTFSKILNKKKN